MTTFTSFSDLLPDPNNKIGTAGDNTNISGNTGYAGPGFAKVKFSSSNNTQVSRTISGRGVTASPSYHNWSFDVSYNPMTRDEFEPVASFLEGRRGRLYPFYVILPQYAKPRDIKFAAYAKSRSVTPTSVVLDTVNNTITFTFATQYKSDGTVITNLFYDNPVYISGILPVQHNGQYSATSNTQNSVVLPLKSTLAITNSGSLDIKLDAILAQSTTLAGSSTLVIRGPDMYEGSYNNPMPGDFITITDPNDTNHKKAYKIVRVETQATSQTAVTNPTYRRLHLVPPLSRKVTFNSVINFINPKFRVIQKGDTLDYDLDTDNLYQFSLSLEEILP